MKKIGYWIMWHFWDVIERIYDLWRPAGNNWYPSIKWQRRYYENN